MYCGHCGAPVGDQDAFCNTCGARFVDPAPAAFAPPTAAAAATTVLPAAAPPDAGPPTDFVPITPTPDRRRWRAFAIGAAFALIAVAGVVAFVVFRGDDTSAGRRPDRPTVVESTTTTATATTQPPTTPPPTSAAPSTGTTVPPPTEPPTRRRSRRRRGGTVPANTATIPGTAHGPPRRRRRWRPRHRGTAAATTTPRTTAPPTRPTPVAGSSLVDRDPRLGRTGERRRFVRAADELRTDERARRRAGDGVDDDR